MARRPAALLAALALFLAAPAAALAQGAGDDQYSDPFGDEQTDSGGQDDAAQEPAQEPEPAEPAEPAPAEPAPAAPAPEATSAQQPTQLAYTGAEEGLVALAGAVLLVGGVALRVRLSGPAPRRR